MRAAVRFRMGAVGCAMTALVACSATSGPAASNSPAPSSSTAPSSPPVTSSPTSSAAPSSSHSITPKPHPSTSTPRPHKRVSHSRPPTYSGGTVVLNPGHNGGNASHSSEINRQVPAGYGDYKACDTTGTETNAGYAEHAFNWDVSLRVRTVLRAHGVPVVLTRPTDIGVGPCVDERAAIGNRTGVAAVVSIHADGAPSSGHGFHVNQDSRRPDGATAHTAAQSVDLGQAIHAALARSSGLVPSTYIGRDGYYYRSDLAGLNLARKPTTFLELGNMRNAGDAARQSSSAGRERIAKAIAAGILAYLGR